MTTQVSQEELKKRATIKDIMTTSLTVATLMRDKPLTPHEKEVITDIIHKHLNAPDFNIQTFITELEYHYNKGDKELESLLFTFRKIFNP